MIAPHPFVVVFGRRGPRAWIVVGGVGKAYSGDLRMLWLLRRWGKRRGLIIVASYSEREPWAAVCDDGSWRVMGLIVRIVFVGSWP